MDNKDLKIAELEIALKEAREAPRASLKGDVGGFGGVVVGDYIAVGQGSAAPHPQQGARERACNIAGCGTKHVFSCDRIAAELQRLYDALAEVTRERDFQRDEWFKYADKLTGDRDAWKAKAEALQGSAGADMANCKTCSGTGSMTSEVARNGEVSCNICKGSGKLPKPMVGDVWKGTRRHIHQEKRTLIKEVEDGAFQTDQNTIIDAVSFINGDFELVSRNSK